MNILVCAATDKEISHLLEGLIGKGMKPDAKPIRYGKHTLTFLVTGVGAMKSAVAISTFPNLEGFDLLLQLGIAGSYKEKFPIGTVVEVVSEQLGDLGAEMADGTFSDVFELDLVEKNQFPFSSGTLQNTQTFTEFQKTKGLTVNKVHGTQDSITKIKQKYNPDIESMEGAGFFYAALLAQKPFCQLRSISNAVEPRNREHWNIELAIQNVTQETLNLLEKLS